MEKQMKVNLDAINISPTNAMFRRPHEFTREALKGLTTSIETLGVVSPISLRPDPKQKGKYELMAGQRRFHAAKFAGLKAISATIQSMSDEEALQVQITENLQREAVHPLDEAKGYRKLMEQNEKTTVKTLASTFGKVESHIVQRLKLSDLIKEAEKDFYSGAMTIGHAIILARLTPKDQRQAIENITRYNDGYGTVAALEKFIERNIMNSLTKAPFDTNDATLIEKAGACINCPLRSGSLPSLFAEIKDKDRCFNRECFQAKCDKTLLIKVQTTIETKPEVVILKSYGTVNEHIQKLLDDHKITPLKEYDDFTTLSKGEKLEKVKGLWASGSSAGKITSVILKKQARKKLTGEDAPQEAIAKIQQRIARGKELDAEKVYGKILEAIKAHPTQQEVTDKKLMQYEEMFLLFMVYDKAGYSQKQDFQKILKINDQTPETFLASIQNLTAEQKAFMVRKVMMDQYGGNYPKSKAGLMIRKIAETYEGINIAQFEADQLAIQNKREERQQERIKALKKAIKILPVKTPAPSKKKPITKKMKRAVNALVEK